MDVLSYYFCPLAKLGHNGYRVSNVKITRISTDIVKVSCPDVKGDITKITKFEISESELLHPTEHNDYIECIRTFCNLNTRIINKIKIDSTISLGVNAISIDKKKTLKDRTDLVLISQEVANYDVLIKKYVENNDYRSFLQMHKDIGLFVSTDKNLTDRFSFCKKTVAIQKVFEILRYDFLVCNHLMLRNSELEPKLVGWILEEKLKQFDFLLDDELFDDFSYSTSSYLKIKQRYK